MTILTDTIGEYTPAAGVTIDGLAIKDGGIRTLLNLSKLGTNTLYVDPKGGGAYTTLSAALTAAALLTPSTTNEVLIVVTGEVAETAPLTALDHVHVLFLAGASVTVTNNSTLNGVYFASLTNTTWAAIDKDKPTIIRVGTVGAAVQGASFISCSASVRLVNIYVQNATTGSASSSGIYSLTSLQSMIDCTAIGGSGGNTCAGFFNNGSSPTMTRCTGIGGDSGASCNGIYNYNGSAPVMTRCTGVGGSGGINSSGFNNATTSNPTMVDCIGYSGGAYRKNATATIAASSRQEDTFQPTASHPWRLLGVTVTVSAAAAGGVTLTLRDATGGGGNALSAAQAVDTTGAKYIPVTGHRIITAGNNVFAYLSASDATLAYTITYVYETAYATSYGLFHDTNAPVTVQDCTFISNAASNAVYVTSNGDDASKFIGGSARSGLNDAGRQVAFAAQSSWDPAQVFGMTLDGGTTNISGGSWVNATTNKLVGGGGIIAPSIQPRIDGVDAVGVKTSAGTTFVSFDSTNSRVGIGTTAPATKLHVSGGNVAVDNNYGLAAIPSAGGAPVFVLKVDTGNDVIIGSSSFDDVLFYTGNLGAPVLALKQNTGLVGIGTSSPFSLLHINQSVTNAAIPPLQLDQADVSEEMIEFNSTVGVGNAIEAVGAKTLTTTHFIKATITGVGTVYIPVGTIA